MAATVVFKLQGVTPTTIDATDILQFAGAAFNDAIIIDEWNDSTHVKSSVGADDSSANTPNNNKFISQAGGGGGDSQADWGDGTEDLDQITNGEAALKITVTNDSAVEVTGAKFYAYDGADTSEPPTGMSFKAAEVGDTNFTDAEGSGSALGLTDQGSATDHDYYIVVSSSPASGGLKSNKMRFEATLE